MSFVQSKCSISFLQFIQHSISFENFPIQFFPFLISFKNFLSIKFFSKNFSSNKNLKIPKRFACFPSQKFPHNFEFNSIFYSHQNAQNNNAKSSSKTVEITRQNHAAEVAITRDGSRDATSDYSIANTETVVMTGNDVEMKIRATYPPEFRGIPPPPAFVNRLDITNEPNTSTAKTEEHQ